MADTETKTAVVPQPAALQSAVDVIFDSVTEALGSAFSVWILGGAALSIASGFTDGMVPSLPPGFDTPEAAEAHHSGHHSAWWHMVRGDAFILFFAIFLAHSLWVGFRDGEGRNRRRMLRILSNLRENWFGLVVGNAIGAWVGVLILGIVQDFSPWHIFWHSVWEMVLPAVEGIGRLVFGATASSSLGAWLSWYGANQTKLTFWIIYLGGAFDDLGIPNFKTLARWAWRRRQKQKDPQLTC